LCVCLWLVGGFGVLWFFWLWGVLGCEGGVGVGWWVLGVGLWLCCVWYDLLVLCLFVWLWGLWGGLGVGWGLVVGGVGLVLGVVL